MAGVMLATYPELFAAGAIIAGLPYGTATSMSQALDRMRGRGLPADPALAALVDGAAPAGGRVPRVSVWHGDADATVVPANADAIVAQWRGVHGLAYAPDEVEQVEGHAHRLWRDAQGRAAVEEYRIRGLGHGTPLATTGADGLGQPGPHMLEAGISSTLHSAAFFGLIERPSARAAATRAKPKPASPRPHPWSHSPGRSQVGDMINGALRAAGLLR
jgi:poly(3-hydroxybutyrate) depolymerase